MTKINKVIVDGKEYQLKNPLTGELRTFEYNLSKDEANIDVVNQMIASGFLVEWSKEEYNKYMQNHAAEPDRIVFVCVGDKQFRVN